MVFHCHPSCQASEEQIGAAGGQEIQLGAVQVMVGHKKVNFYQILFRF